MRCVWGHLSEETERRFPHRAEVSVIVPRADTDAVLYLSYAVAALAATPVEGVLNDKGSIF